MPCWQYLDIPYQAYVPLQWADNLAQMLALAHDRLDYFEQPVHLVGFSMGGYLAALLALQAPEKIASLTLIANTCQAFPEAELVQRQHLLTALKQGKFKGMSDKQIMAMLHSANHQNAALLSLIRNMQQDLGMATLLSQMSATSNRKNLLTKLAECEFAIRFIAGEEDHLATEAQLRFAQAQIKGSTVTLIPEAGHMLPMEQPKQLADFLVKALKP